MNMYGTLKIRIVVIWQGVEKQVTVHSRGCDREDALKEAQTFFKHNPCCLQCRPIVEWQYIESIDVK